MTRRAALHNAYARDVFHMIRFPADGGENFIKEVLP